MVLFGEWFEYYCQSSSALLCVSLQVDMSA